MGAGLVRYEVVRSCCLIDNRVLKSSKYNVNRINYLVQKCSKYNVNLVTSVNHLGATTRGPQTKPRPGGQSTATIRIFPRDNASLTARTSDAGRSGGDRNTPELSMLASIL